MLYRHTNCVYRSTINTKVNLLSLVQLLWIGRGWRECPGGSLTVILTGASRFQYLFTHLLTDRFILVWNLRPCNEAINYCLSFNSTCDNTLPPDMWQIAFCAFSIYPVHWVAWKRKLHTTRWSRYIESYKAIPVPPTCLPRCIMQRHLQKTTQVRCLDLVRTHSLRGAVLYLGKVENSLYIMIFNTKYRNVLS